MPPGPDPAAAGLLTEKPTISSGGGVRARVQYYQDLLKACVILLVKNTYASVSTFNWRRSLQPKILFGWDDAVDLRPGSSSWLDGLRGLASVQVYFFHFFGRHAFWSHTYGSTPEDKYIHELPIFRSIWGAGSGAVSCFFVISGYAITIKSFTLMRRQNYDDLYSGLCSSLMRRGFRLFLPLFLLAIPTMFLFRIVDMKDGFAYPDEIRPTLGGQFVHLLNASDIHFNPFAYHDNGPGSINRYAYVPPSWTIPMEYYGSIVCYLMVMMVSRIVLYRTRVLLIGFTAFYSLHRGSWWTSNFLVGMLIADYVTEQKASAPGPAVGDSTRQKLIHNIKYGAMLFVGWYFAGLPPKLLPYEFAPVPRPGYEFLYNLYPPFWIIGLLEDTRWYWYWCGNLTVFAVSQLPALRSGLDSRFCQWLGKLSFAIYLVHAHVISAMSHHVQPIIKTITEHKGLVCLFEFSILTPIVFMLAVVVERYIDRPSVQFAKWFEQTCNRPSTATELG